MANSGTSNRDVPAGFTLAVDNAMSSYAGDLGTSPVLGFASAVDNAISSYGGDLGGSHSPEHGFASVVDNAMTSYGGDLGASHTPVHGFPSSVDNVISSYAGSYSPVHGFQLFTLAELVAATNNFSLDNMIGAGSIGVVYRAKLVDGREVAIKRVETRSKRKELQEIVLGYLLAFLSRLHHKHLVGLVGFCAEKDKRLFLYEYMKNGALYDHLHHKGSRVLNSWKRRIKIALDASRGIEYLHNYAVPSIIHGGIKSSNILLDVTWTARVSDFGLSFMKKTAGTVGYIDPEYLARHVVTTKSDVYGLGVVLLELLTGKTPIFKSGEDGGSVVDFAVPPILSGEWVKILDPRIGQPDVNEADAVELVAYTALHCVNLEGKDRPTMADVVVNLESALAICCHSSHESISSGTIPAVLPTKKKKKNFCCFRMI